MALANSRSTPSPGDSTIHDDSNMARVCEITILGLEELAEGGWRFDAEESMPMTAGQRRDWFMNMLQSPPQVAQTVGLGHPANLAKFQEVMATPDWVVPNLAARDRLFDIIRQLLTAQPTVGPDGRPVPTIRANPFLFNPGLAVELLREWLLSDAGRQAEEETPDGFANVLAYAMEYFSFLQQPPPSAGAGLPPPGRRPGGPPNRPSGGELGVAAPPPEPGLEGAPPGAEGLPPESALAPPPGV